MERKVTFTIDEARLKELETTFENELGWLEESGIIVKSIEETADTESTTISND